MKVKRLKRAARVLTFYRYNFGYHPPHSVLLDGTFCQAALQNKINLREQMPKYLAEPQVEMFTTECVMNELKQLGKPLHGAFVICEQFRISKCPHKPMRTAAECIAHLARRSRKEEHTKYFVATQDDALLEKLRLLGGVPLMSIRFNTIILEKPSEQTKLEAENNKKKVNELDKVRELRRQLLGEQEKRHRKRKAKGPNPLSCKKKKKKPDSNQQEQQKRFERDNADEQASNMGKTPKLNAAERAKMRRLLANPQYQIGTTIKMKSTGLIDVE